MTFLISKFTSWFTSSKLNDYLVFATQGVDERAERVGKWAVTQLQKKAIYQETLKGSLTRWVFSKKFRTPIEALDALDQFATKQLGRVQRVKALVICFTDLQTYAREFKTILQRATPLRLASNDVNQKALEEILPVLETACREKLQNLDRIFEESDASKPQAVSSPMKTMQSLASWAFGSPAKDVEKGKQDRNKAEKKTAYEELPQQLREALTQVKNDIDSELAAREQATSKGIISMTIDAATEKLTSWVTSGLVYGLTAWGTKVAANTAVQYVQQPETEEEQQQYTRQIANTVYLTFLTTLVLSYSLRIAIWKRQRETTAASPATAHVTNRLGTSFDGLDKPSFVQRTTLAARGAIARLTGFFRVNIDPGVATFEQRTQ